MEKIDVTLMDRDLSLSCEAQDRDQLLEAVKQANDLMVQIRQAMPNTTYERIALMACVQLSRQLLSAQSTEGPFQGLVYGDVMSKLSSIHRLLDETIDKLK